MPFLIKRTKKISEKFNSIIEKPLLTSTIVLFVVAFIVVGLSLPYYISDFDQFIQQILAEAHGMIFDIAVIGILIFWLNQNGEMRQRIRTYKDEIDDFRLWESEEAAFRTVGNIKRLNRHRIHDLNTLGQAIYKVGFPAVQRLHGNGNPIFLGQWCHFLG